MSSWLRNIQSQLTDFAQEVLAEATDEVEDLHTQQQRAEVEELRLQKEMEMATLMRKHEQSMRQMREAYEKRIDDVIQGTVSASMSNVDLLDAVLLEKEELLETKKKLEQMVKSQHSLTTEETAMTDVDLTTQPTVTSSTDERDEIEERLRTAETEVDRLKQNMLRIVAEHEQENMKLQGVMKTNADLLEKRERELQRLKEHLIEVEEALTKDAIESEQMESNLRSLVAELQKTHCATASGASETTHIYETQLADLRSNLEFVTKETSMWKLNFETEEKLRVQSQEALASLQGVVRELAADHEKAAELASHQNVELQSRVAELTRQMGTLKAELKRVELDKQAVEEELEKKNGEYMKAQKTIQELEEHNAALCASSRNREEISNKKNGLKFDNEVLRQLMLNYFTATAEHRPEIALLLASLLEFPPEDVEKIKQAFRYSIMPSGSPFKASLSLADQFVRFLENESVSVENAPSLPAPTISVKIREPSSDLSHLKSTASTTRETSPQNTGSSTSMSASDPCRIASSLTALDSMLR